MSIKFIPCQIKIPESKAYGKWFAKMVSIGRITTEQLAEELSHNSSVTHADILAVLYSLAPAIRQHLLQSETVHLEGLGTLRVSLRSHMVDDEMSVNEKLIYNYKIIFNSDITLNHVRFGEESKHKGFYTKNLIDGIRVSHL